MRPEGFPPGKKSGAAAVRHVGRVRDRFNEAGRFPSRKTSNNAAYWQTFINQASMRPEGFPPGKENPAARATAAATARTLQ